MRALAEDPAAHTAAPDEQSVVATEGFVLFFPPRADMPGVVQRVRLEERAVENAVEVVRRHVREHGRASCTWWIGDSSTPPALADRLRGLGFAAPEPPTEPRLTAMALIEQPEAPAEIEVRRVETLEDYVAARKLEWSAFGMPEEQRAAARASLPELWARVRANPWTQTFLACVDRQPAATGLMLFAESGAALIGAATLPELRGRGAYRALVRARWDEAVARGTPALVVQAGAMSRPILERLGFVAVATIEVLVDR